MRRLGKSYSRKRRYGYYRGRRVPKTSGRTRAQRRARIPSWRLRRRRTFRRSSRSFRKLKFKRKFPRQPSESIVATAGDIPLPLVEVLNYGLYSYTISRDSTVAGGSTNTFNSIVYTEPSAIYPWSPLTGPTVFGSYVGAASHMYSQSWSFVFNPILKHIFDINPAAVTNQAFYNKLFYLINNYRYWRLARMKFTFLPRKPVTFTQAIPGDPGSADINYQNVTAGPDAYFMISRFGGAITDCDGATPGTWTGLEAHENSAWAQMDSLYSYNRRRMVHVPDMNMRTKPIVLSFVPTEQVPEFTYNYYTGTSVPGLAPGGTDFRSGAPHGVGDLPKRYVKSRWHRTQTIDNSGTSWKAFDGRNYYGICGAYKMGSWRAECLKPWHMRMQYVFQFKGRTNPTNASTLYNAYTNFPLGYDFYNTF